MIPTPGKLLLRSDVVTTVSVVGGAPSSATISTCGRYRYTLERQVALYPRPALCWLMLNPSTADAHVDDHTISKVMGFTSRAGYATAIVVNLFAWRATNPQNLRTNLDVAEGLLNHRAVTDAVLSSHAVVCAWGATPWAQPQADRVLGWVRDADQHARLLCLGRTRSGAPMHPLMPSYAGHPLVPYDPHPYIPHRINLPRGI